MPTVTALTAAPPDVDEPRQRADIPALKAILAGPSGPRLIHADGETFRVVIDATGADPPAVLLPFDRLFEIRAGAAMRLWRILHHSNPGKNPARLTRYRRRRLTLALRALDGLREGQTYFQIAELVTRARILSREWNSHEAREAIKRLVQSAEALMLGGYFELLLQPYRRPPRRMRSRNLNTR